MIFSPLSSGATVLTVSLCLVAVGESVGAASPFLSSGGAAVGAFSVTLLSGVGAGVSGAFFSTFAAGFSGAGAGFFGGSVALSLRLAASKSMVPTIFSPGTTLAATSGVLGRASFVGALACSGLASVSLTTGLASSLTTGGGGGGGCLATTGGGGGGITFGAGGITGLGGAGGLIGRVPMIKLSASCLIETDLENSFWSSDSISGLTCAIGLFSMSKPFPLRNSTMVEVPTFNSFATFTNLLLIRMFKHFYCCGVQTDLLYSICKNTDAPIICKDKT